MLFFALLSCKSTKKTLLSGKDTATVFQSILESKIFVKENICAGSDSLYMLKNKYFNNSWPQKSTYFNIFFIADKPQSKILNFGPNSPYDGRTRISILKFLQKEDTVSVLMLNHGPNVFFEYNLIRENNLWRIVNENYESGGRKSYYGFEKDQWYIDLKKKMKPTKRLFPPATLKK